MRKNRLFQVLALGILSFITFNPVASAVLTPIEGTGALGSYTGSFDYSASNSTTAQFTISLTNTSPADNGGYLTAFVFNNPFDYITGVSLVSSDPDFALLGGPTFDDGVNGSPYGQFDIGSSTGSSFEGGGNPSTGIAVGSTESFTFSFTGSNLDNLTEQSFLAALSVPPGDGQGDEGFVARFRGFEDGGSDKVPAGGGGQPVVPEPATMLLFGAGAVGAYLKKKKKV
jgi:hypothetical protein